MDHTVHGILQAIILEWVAFLFSRGNSQSMDKTQVSCIAGRFFTIWATREYGTGKKKKKKIHRSIQQDRKWEINPHSYHQLIYYKEENNIKCRKILFNKWCWKNLTVTCKRMKLKYSPTPYSKTNAKWVKDLNVRPIL